MSLNVPGKAELTDEHTAHFEGYVIPFQGIKKLFVNKQV